MKCRASRPQSTVAPPPSAVRPKPTQTTSLPTLTVGRVQQAVQEQQSSMSARTRALARKASIVGGLAAASLPLGAAKALEQATTNSYLAAGTHITYAFGAEQPWGWGIELRAGAMYEDVARYDCYEDINVAFFGGGALRFEAFPASHARMVIAAQGGPHALVGVRSARGSRVRLSLGQ